MACTVSDKMTSVDVLSRLLANTYVLLLKTQNVHWNTTNAEFGYLHSMTESHYSELFEAVDEIAERIRMLGNKAPATFSEYLKLSCIPETVNTEEYSKIVKELANDHSSIIDGLRKALDCLSNMNDFGTIDLLTARLKFHEKIAWMLNSSL